MTSAYKKNNRLRPPHFPFLVIVIVGVVLTFPVIISGFPVAHDTVAHVIWHTYFSEQIFMGDVYPRWLMNANAGLGSPTFFFYGPVSFYFSSLFKGMFGQFLGSLHQLGLASVAAVLLSGIGSYCWLSNKADMNSAIWGSILYMVLPYHFLVDLHVRASYAELWALTWLPFILFFTDKIFEGYSRARIGLILFYPILIMTHLPTTLIFSPFLISYAAFLAVEKKRHISLIHFFSALTIGIGVSAVYLIPALAMQKTILMSDMSSGKFNYVNNFIFESNVDNEPFRQHLQFMAEVTLFTVFVFCLSVAVFFFSQKRTEARQTMFWTIVFFFSVFMMLPVSKPIWDVLPPLQRIQFPWRFHVVLCVATTIVFLQSITANTNPAKSAHLLRRIYPGFLFCLIILFHMDLGVLSDKPKIWKSTQPQLASYKQANINLGFGPSEYFPTTAGMILRERSVTRTYTASGKGDVDILEWYPRNILLDVHAESDLELRVAQYFFPGWEARDEEEGVQFKVKPTDTLGILSLNIPKGDRRIRVRLCRHKSELIGWITSSMSLFIALLLFFRVDLRKR